MMTQSVKNIKKKSLILVIGFCLSFGILAGCGVPQTEKPMDSFFYEDRKVSAVNSDVQPDEESINTEIKDDVIHSKDSIDTEIKGDVPQYESNDAYVIEDDTLREEKNVVSAVEVDIPKDENDVVSAVEADIPKDENDVVSAVEVDIPKDENDVISAVEDSIPDDKNSDVSDIKDDIYEGEEDEAWDSGTDGTDFYEAETGLFRLYSWLTNDFLIALKLPDRFSMSYADKDGISYTIIDENYNVISVFGTASTYAQMYLSDGTVPTYYDKESDSYAEYTDYQCEIADFPICGHNSMLVSESYTDADGHKFKYNYFWIPYNDNEGNEQYIQFTISIKPSNGNTDLSLENILTEMLDSE